MLKTVLAGVLAGCVFMSCRKQEEVPAVAADALVLLQLEKAGSDLTKPHAVEFFLYLPHEARAREAAKELEGRGYATKVDPATLGKDWLCLATRSLVPTMEALLEARTQFEALAVRLGGEYDGWGASHKGPPGN